MNANQFISYLEGLLAAQDKETKLSKAIRAKLKEVSREEEWVAPYFKRDYAPPVIVPLTNPPLPTDWRDKPYC
jgi:hypothetical protein